jgi:hypothetical protein
MQRILHFYSTQKDDKLIAFGFAIVDKGKVKGRLGGK